VLLLTFVNINESVILIMWKLFNWQAIFIALFCLFVWNPANGANIPILWDTSHGVQWNYSPEQGGLYYAVRQLLGKHGFVIKTNLNNELTENLSTNQFEVLVLTVAVDEAYKKAEAENIKQFVQRGGKLLVLCDTAYSVGESGINNITNRFGITCGIDNISSDVLKKFFKHPLFSNVFRVRLDSAGSLKVNSPAQTIAYSSSRQEVIAIAEVGTGKVIVIGDLDVFKDDYISKNAINKPFALAAFRWFASNPVVKKPDIGSTNKDRGNNPFTEVKSLIEWAKPEEGSSNKNDDEDSILEQVRQTLEQMRPNSEGNELCERKVLQQYKSQLRVLDKKMKTLTELKNKVSSLDAQLTGKITPLKRKMDEFLTYRKTSRDNNKQENNWSYYELYVLRWRDMRKEQREVKDRLASVTSLYQEANQMLENLQNRINICK
jgi:hypothetical protein